MNIKTNGHFKHLLHTVLLLVMTGWNLSAYAEDEVIGSGIRKSINELSNSFANALKTHNSKINKVLQADKEAQAKEKEAAKQQKKDDKANKKLNKALDGNIIKDSAKAEEMPKTDEQELGVEPEKAAEAEAPKEAEAKPDKDESDCEAPPCGAAPNHPPFHNRRILTHNCLALSYCPGNIPCGLRHLRPKPQDSHAPCRHESNPAATSATSKD